MKTTFAIISLFLVLLACQNKQDKIVPIVYTKPDATILVVNVNESNTAAFTFRLNNGDIYIFDFGDGTTLTDSLARDAIKLDYYRIGHQYAKNGDYNVTLTIKNPKYSSSSQTIVEARRIARADFSYEILANGQVKLKNLSENKYGYYEWSIGTYALTNGNYFIYKSGKEAPTLNFDLNGKYKIKLRAINGNTSEVTKTIDVNNAKKQMTFSGYYKDKKTNITLNNSDFYYTSYIRDGIINQLIYSQDYEGVQSTLLWKDYYFPFDTRVALDKKYSLIRDYIKTNDKDLIELEEEILDPDLYNNTAEIYTKALWIKYKVKNEHLNGELKIRLLIR